MKYKILILVLVLSSCSTPNECPELNYNSINKLTTLSDGVKRSIQQYLNGVDYGNWIFYFSNGKVETKGKFRDGMRVGKWKYYYESGNIKQVSNYSKLGERQGKWIEYDENGKATRTTKY